MVNNRLVIAAAVMVFCAGCSKEYAHERLESDGPEAARVRALVQALRQAGADALDETIVRQTRPGLTEYEVKSLRFALDKIVAADSVELQKTEKFGKQVYRVVLAIETADGPESLAMLLAIGADDKMRWIGKN